MYLKLKPNFTVFKMWFYYFIFVKKKCESGAFSFTCNDFTLFVAIMQKYLRLLYGAWMV